MRAALKYLHKSITKKLLVYVFSIYVVVTLSATMLHMFSEYKNASNKAQEQLILFEKIMKPVLTEALWNFDEKQINTSLSGILKSNFIIGAKITANDNTLKKINWYKGVINIEDKNKSTVTKEFNSITGELEDIKSGYFTNGIFYHKFPLIYTDYNNKNHNIGVVYLYSSSGAIVNEVKMGFIFIIVNAIIKTLCLWIFFLWFGYLHLTKPLQILTSATKKISTGNLDDGKVIIKTKWPTEIDDLTNDFNNMVEQLIHGRKKLNSEKERMTEIINSMPSALVCVDHHGRITDWNHKMEELSGISHVDAINENIMHQKLLNKYINEINIAIKNRELVNINNIEIPIKNTKQNHDITIYPINLDVYSGAVIRIDNITERMHMESLIVQTEKMSSVGSLAAGMAHEINNPLGSVLQGAQNILRRVDPNVKANIKVANELDLDLEKMNVYLKSRKITNFLDGIRDAGERASKIVSNLLQFSRKSNVKKNHVSIDSIIENSIALASTDYDLKQKTDFKHIEINIDCPKDLPELYCCQMEIEQVMLNLLKNASQAMKNLDRKPIINISAFNQDKRFIKIIVEDNGPGMTPEICKRVFEPFFTTKAVGEGTGLGLAVSYGIITETHKGEFLVESKVDKGSIFTLILPLESKDNNQN